MLSALILIVIGWNNGKVFNFPLSIWNIVTDDAYASRRDINVAILKITVHPD